MTLQPAETQPNGLFCTVKWANNNVIGPKSMVVLNCQGLLYKARGIKGEGSGLIFISQSSQGPPIKADFNTACISCSENKCFSRFDFLVLVRGKNTLHHGFPIGHNRNPGIFLGFHLHKKRFFLRSPQGIGGFTWGIATLRFDRSWGRCNRRRGLLWRLAESLVNSEPEEMWLALKLEHWSGVGSLHWRVLTGGLLPPEPNYAALI